MDSLNRWIPHHLLFRHHKRQFDHHVFVNMTLITMTLIIMMLIIMLYITMIITLITTLTVPLAVCPFRPIAVQTYPPESTSFFADLV